MRAIFSRGRLGYERRQIEHSFKFKTFNKNRNSSSYRPTSYSVVVYFFLKRWRAFCFLLAELLTNGKRVSIW